jgi:hypothetical protein
MEETRLRVFVGLHQAQVICEQRCSRQEKSTSRQGRRSSTVTLCATVHDSAGPHDVTGTSIGLVKQHVDLASSVKRIYELGRGPVLSVTSVFAA